MPALPLPISPVICSTSEIIWSLDLNRRLVGLLARVSNSVARPVDLTDTQKDSSDGGSAVLQGRWISQTFVGTLSMGDESCHKAAGSYKHWVGLVGWVISPVTRQLDLINTGHDSLNGWSVFFAGRWTLYTFSKTTRMGDQACRKAAGSYKHWVWPHWTGDQSSCKAHEPYIQSVRFLGRVISPLVRPLNLTYSR
jgi:hypothetical protein